MGHTQFMPSSFQELAVDHTGDGRRDIWGDDPADALASAANYLARSGWTMGQPWGVEVRLPQGFDYALVGQSRKSPSEWRRLGVKPVRSGALRGYGNARLFLPAGHAGPAFLLFRNFDVIRRYNPADAYAVGVGHLGARLLGQPDFATSWPHRERALKAKERRELQYLLTKAGYDTRGVDGRLGPNTQKALRRWQRRQGLVPDGVPSLRLLRKLRHMKRCDGVCALMSPAHCCWSR